MGSILLAVGISLAGTFLSLWIFFRTLWRRNPLLQLTRKLNFANFSAGQNQPPPAKPNATPSGSKDARSPVEHQYDRER